MRSLTRWRGWLFFPWAVFAASANAQAPDSTTSAAPQRLVASAAPAWTPPATVARSEPWEAALQFPGRLLSLPLSGLGWLGERGAGWVEDSNLLPRTLEWLAIQQRIGTYIVPASLGDRTGTGVEVRFIPNLFNRSMLAELSASTRQYNRERLALRLGPVRPVYLSDWRSRDLYFGDGLQAPVSGKSAYALRRQSLLLALVYPFREVGYDALRVAEVAAINPSLVPANHPIRTQFAVWAGPRYAFMTDGRDPKYPSFEEEHPQDAAGSFHQPVEHFTWGGRIVLDRRVGSPHWTNGWKLRFDGQRFDRSIEALALKNASTDARRFTRLSAQGETGVSWGRDPRTIRLKARVVDQQLDDEGGTFLISDLSVLGGAEGLSGYEAGRFQDLDLALGELGYIFPIGKNLEIDAHVEVGGVFPDLEAARSDQLKNSYGIMLRVRGDRSLIGEVGVEWSREQTRFRFSFGGEQ